VQVAQGVPLHERQPQGGQSVVRRPVVTVLQSLDGQGDPGRGDPVVLLPRPPLWGESDRIVDPEYGRAFAAAIASSVFTLLPRTGHLPQVETPEKLLGALLDLDRQ
jgi:hypothetical protein